MRKYLIFAAMLAIVSSGTARAEQPDVVVYINPLEYQHPIKLWQFYYDYWYTQGPPVEKAAMETLGEAFGQVSMCDGNNIGKILVRIIPSMFYNPHMTTFYGKIRADVYTGSGKPLGAYINEVSTLGFLDVAPAEKIAATYRMAMQNIVGEMKRDDGLQQAIAHGVPDSETSTPCSMMMILPVPKMNNLLNTFER